ncbi:MAG: TonB-dependent receptor family protein [Alistipes sp.]|nr:TonB-dependent receptor family protein [Alistipes sp.]
MKQLSFIAFIAMLLFAAPVARAAEAKAMAEMSATQQRMLRGNIVDEQGAYISYVTIVAMQDGRQVSGVSSDNQGHFSFYVPDGTYNIVIECVGYETYEREVTMPEGADMGTITLKESSTEIDDVIVKAQMIRREADRFVVDVANAEAAVGRNGMELLRQSPGVWVQEDNISINGSSGTKLFVNNREIKLSGEALVNYVKNLRAEDISKIEVVPQTGADQDADSRGGIIFITLRRRLDNGVMGSVSMQTNQGKSIVSYDPSASINAHVGKFDISASGWYANYDINAISREKTIYHKTNALMEADSEIGLGVNDGAANISAVAELNPRHSIGLALEFQSTRQEGPTDSYTSYRMGDYEQLNVSRYEMMDKSTRYAAALNYIIKTDTLGSTLKFIADYNQSTPTTLNDSRTSITQGGQTVDSLYYNRSNSTFRIATAQVARERRLSANWLLKYGAKYTYNEINSATTYRYLLAQAWVPSVVDDYDISYIENIGAAYATATANYGRFSAVVGLRGEYTYANGRESDVEQNYFSLFPNANFSYALDKTGKHSIVAQYSRSISRASFWNLTPRRLQISDYTYQTGNPALRPQFVNQYSLTAVLGYKYSLTFVVQSMKDAIQQKIVGDPLNPNMMNLTVENLPTLNQYAVIASLPFTLTKWWDWNTNLTGGIIEQRLDASAPKTNKPFAQWYTAMTFKLPKKFFVDANYSGQTGVEVSNLKTSASHSLDVNFKKLIKDSWILQIGLQKLVRQRNNFISSNEDFTREVDVFGQGQDFNVRFSVTWNFKSGKQFRSKSVERGADASRM